MCGRYSHSDGMAAISDLVAEEKRILAALRPRYNITPRQYAPVVQWWGEIISVRTPQWGLVPPWAPDDRDAAKLINARSETVAVKPSFRSAFRKRRCLVLADGWYEWVAQGRQKLPWRMEAVRGDGLITFGGLTEMWESAEGRRMGFTGTDQRETFCILTTEANAVLSRIHHRMPVIIHKSCWEEWLDPVTPPARLEELMRAADDADFHAFRVTAKMNSREFESPEAIQPLAREEQEPEQGELIL